jgi:hypothetical protein
LRREFADDTDFFALGAWNSFDRRNTGKVRNAWVAAGSGEFLCRDALRPVFFVCNQTHAIFNPTARWFVSLST